MSALEVDMGLFRYVAVNEREPPSIAKPYFRTCDRIGGRVLGLRQIDRTRYIWETAT